MKTNIKELKIYFFVGKVLIYQLTAVKLVQPSKSKGGFEHRGILNCVKVASEVRRDQLMAF